MKTKVLSLLVALLTPLSGWAEEREFTDETYQVIYTYDTDGTEASVRGGAGNSVTGSPNAKGDIIILDKFVADGKEYTVTAINQSAFVNCFELTSVVIPSTIKIIGSNAFNSCLQLNHIDLPESIEVIEDLAFVDCVNLVSIHIPASVNSIGLQPFFRCRNLQSITVDEGNIYYDSRNNSNSIIETNTGTLISGSNGSIIPLGVKEIAWGAFCYLSGITKTAIPEGVTKLGAYSFEATKIQEVVLPESLQELDWFVFDDCEQLTTVTLPKNLKSIGGGAFENCPSLNSVISWIEEPFEIDESVFRNRGSQTQATLSVPKQAIEKYKSTPNWNLFKIFAIGEEIGEQKEYIDSTNNVVYTFWTDETTATVKAGNDWSTSGSPDAEGDIVIPGRIIVDGKEYRVTEIGTFAFINNDKISSVVLSDTIQDIGIAAFSNCWNLTKVKLPKHLTALNNFVFSNSGLKNIEIPTSVSSIGEGAFRDCPLKSIFIPENINDIGMEAFSGCSEVESVIVDQANISFDSRGNCNAIIRKSTNELIFGFPITIIPSSVGTIGEEAFYGCNGLITITIPEGVETIKRLAFCNCNNLKEIILPNSLKIVEDQVFIYCKQLKTVNIPNNVTSIGFNCFAESGLTSFSFPENVTEVESGIFAACTNLIAVTFHSNIEKIGYNTFHNCPSLHALICCMNEPIQVHDQAFDEIAYKNVRLYVPASSVEKYHSSKIWKNFDAILAYTEGLQFGVEYIDPTTKIVYIFNTDEDKAYVKGGYWNMAGSPEAQGDEILILKSFVSNGKSYTVTSIEKYAFNNEATSIIIPSTIERIGEYAFWNCHSIKSVTVRWKTPIDIDYSVFRNKYNATLYVPKGCKEAYKAANFWNEFREIIEIESEEGILGDANCDGIVDVVDVTTVVDFILGKAQPTSEQRVNADVNKDEVIDVVDLTSIVSIILGTYQPAAATGKAPARIHTNDVLLFDGTDVLLQNNREYVAFQMDVTLQEDAMLNGVQLSERAAGHDVTFRKLNVNTYRIIAYSMDNTPLTGNEGTLFSLNISGNQQAALSNIVFSDGKSGYTLNLVDVTGISDNTLDTQQTSVYDTNGRKLSKPQRGVNILLMRDGTKKKLVLK